MSNQPPRPSGLMGDPFTFNAGTGAPGIVVTFLLYFHLLFALFCVWEGIDSFQFLSLLRFVLICLFVFFNA